MQARILKNPVSPSIMVANDKSTAVFSVLNATNMPETELLEWKRNNPSYSVTEPFGTYFLVSLSALKFKIEIPLDEAQKLVTSMMLFAADSWYDHYVTCNN